MSMEFESELGDVFRAGVEVAHKFLSRVGIVEIYAIALEFRSSVLDPPSELELELLCLLTRWHETEDMEGGSDSARRERAHKVFRLCRGLIEHAEEEVSERLRNEVEAGLVRTQPGAET